MSKARAPKATKRRGAPPAPPAWASRGWSSRATFTLGEFFDVWGQPLSSSQAGSLTAPSGQSLHVFLSGQPYSGDPRALSLTAHADITIEAGQSVPPTPYTFPAGV